MAIIECKECKHQVSSKAKTCPNCGAKVSQIIEYIKSATIIFGCYAIFYYYVTSKNNDEPIQQPPANISLSATESKKVAKSESQPSFVAAVNSQLNNAEASSTANTWEYQTLEDSLTKKTESVAAIQSNNQVQLEFPYRGGTSAWLIARKHPRHGTDLIFQIDNGQLLCSSYKCNIAIRIDDQPVKVLKGLESDSHSSKVIFFPNAKKLINQIKSSKTVVVEVQFYRQGAYTFEFNTTNLKF